MGTHLFALPKTSLIDDGMDWIITSEKIIEPARGGLVKKATLSSGLQVELKALGPKATPDHIAELQNEIEFLRQLNHPLKRLAQH